MPASFPSQPLLTMPKATHAVLLAGGTGHRMPPLPSSLLPKPLLPIANRPMLFYSLYSLHRFNFITITVVIDPDFTNQLTQYITEIYPCDPLVQSLSHPLPNISIVPRPPDSGTADALRGLTFTTLDLLVLSADYVGDIDLPYVLSVHRAQAASCTATFLPMQKFDQPEHVGKQKKQGKKSKSGSEKNLSIDNYVLLSGNNMLGLYSRSDISQGTLTVRSALVQRYPYITLRSDLIDPHVYFFDAQVVTEVLKSYKSISSVRYELVPYLARRQHTLSRLVREGSWSCPGDRVAVFACVLGDDIYAKRANSVEKFVEVNMHVVGGRLDTFMGLKKVEEVKKKGGKKGGKDHAEESPFKEIGEKVSITSDSLVGKNVTAGDRVSLKKSVVGDNVVISPAVKVNSCVIMANVKLKEAVNLANCVVCQDAVIAKGCVLKDCRVAAGVVIEEGTEAVGKDFKGIQVKEDDSDDHGFEFC